MLFISGYWTLISHVWHHTREITLKLAAQSLGWWGWRGGFKAQSLLYCEVAHIPGLHVLIIRQGAHTKLSSPASWSCWPCPIRSLLIGLAGTKLMFPAGSRMSQAVGQVLWSTVQMMRTVGTVRALKTGISNGSSTCQRPTVRWNGP